MGDSFDELWDSHNGFDAAWDAMPTESAAPVDTQPSWADAGYQVAKDLGEGVFGAVPGTIGFINDLGQSAQRAVTHAVGMAEDPTEKIFRLDTTRKFAGEGAQVFDTLAGVTPEDNRVQGPVEDYSRAVLQSVALPGGPISNAIMGIGAETAHKIAPDSEWAPIVGAAIAHKATGMGRGAAVGAADAAESVANAMDRKSLGTRASDYGTKSAVRTIETPEGAIETQMKATLDKLVEDNALGKSRDPAKLLKVIEEKEAPIQNEINQKIKDYDTGVQAGQNSPAVVSLDNARAMLESGDIPADMVDTYKARIDKLEAGINNRSFGRLSYLQKQKVALGKSYDPADAVLSGFNRAIYSDIKNTIESYVPEVGNLNKQLQPYKVVRPIVERSLTAAENASPMSKLRDVAYTTGGVGVPTLAGTALAGPIGTVAGFGVGVGLKALASPTGQALLARGLRNTAGLTKAMLGERAAPIVKSAPAVMTTRRVAPQKGYLENAVDPTLQPTESTGTPTPYTEKSPTPADYLATGGSKSATSGIASVFAAPRSITESAPRSNSYLESPSPIKEMFKMSAKEDAVAIEQIKADPYYSALAKTESDFNPLAKNPKSSAKGMFQFIDATAKKLGVSDPFNVRDSFEAVRKLTAQNAYRFNTTDPATLYAAHYLGAPLLSKVMRGLDLSPKEAAILKSFETSALPRFKKAYQKIAA